MNDIRNNRLGHFAGPMTVNSQYGQPLEYQIARNIRLGVHFTF
jgi:hypothetical protein